REPGHGRPGGRTGRAYRPAARDRLAWGAVVLEPQLGQGEPARRPAGGRRGAALAGARTADPTAWPRGAPPRRGVGPLLRLPPARLPARRVGVGPVCRRVEPCIPGRDGGPRRAAVRRYVRGPTATALGRGAA